MNIEEVADILSLVKGLPIPKHVFITPERLYEQTGERDDTFFRGLQPVEKPDVIFITSQDANISTIGHEVLHTLGFGEILAKPVGNAIAFKYRMMSNFPRLKQALGRDVRYRKVDMSKDFPNLAKYGDRVEHYELIEG
jgi:hypothetical protein